MRLRSARPSPLPGRPPRTDDDDDAGGDAEAAGSVAGGPFPSVDDSRGRAPLRPIRTHGHGLLLTFLTRPVASQQSPVARRFRYAVDVRRNRRNPQIKRRKFQGLGFAPTIMVVMYGSHTIINSFFEKLSFFEKSLLTTWIFKEENHHHQ